MMAAPVETVPTAWSAMERPRKLVRAIPPAMWKTATRAMTSAKRAPGAELFPMGRDKQDDAAGDQDGGAKESRDSQPSHPSGVDLSLGTPITQTGRRCRIGLRGHFGFVCANAGGGRRIQYAGRLPAG